MCLPPLTNTEECLTMFNSYSKSLLLYERSSPFSNELSNIENGASKVVRVEAAGFKCYGMGLGFR